MAHANGDLVAALTGDWSEVEKSVGDKIKAKTGEHVGPVGRGEAIVCEAVTLIEPADDDETQ